MICRYVIVQHGRAAIVYIYRDDNFDNFIVIVYIMTCD